MPSTLKQVAEACKDDVLGKWLASAIEDDLMAEDLPVDVMPEAPVEDSLKAAFKAAMMAVLDDDSLDTAGKISKLKEILKAHDKVSGAADAAAPTEAEEKPAEGEEKPAEGKEDKKPFESADKAELERLRTELKVRDLCESRDVKLSEIDRKALLALESDEERETFITERATKNVPAPKSRERKDTTENYGGKELGEAKPDGKRLASMVKA